MLILAVDTSGNTASCALIQDTLLLGQRMIYTARAHSQILLPEVKGMLADTGHTVQEVDVFAAANGPGSYTGLRIGELCALQWKDIDVGAGVIHVRKTVQRIWLRDEERYSYMLHVGTPKTPTSRRDVPISHDLMRMLRPLCKVMAADFYIVSNTESRWSRATTGTISGGC